MTAAVAPHQTYTDTIQRIGRQLAAANLLADIVREQHGDCRVPGCEVHLALLAYDAACRPVRIGEGR